MVVTVDHCENELAVILNLPCQMRAFQFAMSAKSGIVNYHLRCVYANVTEEPEGSIAVALK